MEQSGPESNKGAFPKDFLWGAATASYQVEGGIDNNDWAQAAREGKVPECGRACDHYSRYKEDFDIAKELGHNAHRFSIEWARIEPEEGKFDEKEIEHYRAVLGALRARGLEPMVTLWHFTLPTWFVQSGGWLRKDAPQVFARYAEKAAQELGAQCAVMHTMNEPIVYASNGWFRGTWPPFEAFAATKQKGFARQMYMNARSSGRLHLLPVPYFRVRRALVRAHNMAYTTIKSAHPEISVGLVKNVIVFSGMNVFTRTLARIMNEHWTHTFMRGVAKSCDSIGVNYYFYNAFGDKTEYERTDAGWDMVPEKLGDALCMLRRYKKPLYVTEAGLADERDTYRAKYIRESVRGVERALQSGVDVRGFLYWSLLDNYEWADGFTKRFGLVDINYDTLERTIRPSAYTYRDLIRQHTAHDRSEAS